MIHKKLATLSGQPQAQAQPSSEAAATTTSSTKKAGTKAAKGHRSSAAQVDAPSAPLFIPPPADQRVDPAADETWASLLAQLEALLAPAVPALAAALGGFPLTAAGSAATTPTTAAASGLTRRTSIAALAASAVPPSGEQQRPSTSAKRRLCLLLDPQLAALQWEALPAMEARTSAVSRCFSVQQLAQLLQLQPVAATAADGHGSPTASSQQGAAGTHPPALEYDRLTYIVDPLYEQSGSGRYWGPLGQPIISEFRSTVLDRFGSDWSGLVGHEGQVPGEAEYQQLVGSATGLLFLGMGRFGAHLSPKVSRRIILLPSCGMSCILPVPRSCTWSLVTHRRLPCCRMHASTTHAQQSAAHPAQPTIQDAQRVSTPAPGALQGLASLDLSQMAAALVLDRASNASSASRAQREDSRKLPSALLLEEPAAAAALLLLRGASLAAVNTCATSTWTNARRLTTVMEHMAKGSDVTAAVWSASSQVTAEMTCAQRGLVVYGLPVLPAVVGGGGGKRGAGGKGGKKK